MQIKKNFLLQYFYKIFNKNKYYKKKNSKKLKKLN